MYFSLALNSSKRVPLIKFPTRIPWIPKLQNTNFSPALTTAKTTTALPPSGSWTVADTVEVFRVIPNRFRRRPIDPVEIEFISRGGPE